MQLSPLKSCLQNALIDSSLYAHLIHRCTHYSLLRQGEQIHARLILLSATANNFLASKLIRLYARTHRLWCSHNVFNLIPQKNTLAFNALLAAYSVHGQYRKAWELFTLSLSERNKFNVKPDGVTLSCVLKSMSEVVVDEPLLAAVVHSYIMKNGFDFDVIVGNGLVTYYSRSNDCCSARAFFDEMPTRDLVSWNSMISGYSQGGFYRECKELYRMMLDLDYLRPDWVTAISVLHSCTQSADLVFGMVVHRILIESGYEMNHVTCNSLIGFYAKCGRLDYARQLFEDITEKDEVIYTTMISGYMEHGFVDEAMKIFREMQNPDLYAWAAVISGKVQNNQYDKVLDLVRQMQVSGFKPNSVTLSSILPVIPYVSHLNGAKEIHAYAIKLNSARNVYIVSAMINAYAKLGFMSGARRIFDLVDDRNVIVWTAIISGYASQGDATVALGLFNEMLKHKKKPNSVTLSSVLQAIPYASHLLGAKAIHSYAIKTDSNWNNHVVCSMIDAYAKLGFFNGAQRVFDVTDKRDVAVWTAIISAYASHGDAKAAFILFNEMLNSGTKPNCVTFSVLLSACFHSGLTDAACKIFYEVLPKFDIHPLDDHYSIMVACLCRARKLSEAVEFVKKIPFTPTAPVWSALLAGASECGDVELAESAFDHLSELDPCNSDIYIVMTNLYANAGRWEEAEKIRKELKRGGLKKIAGSSRIEGCG